MDRTMICPQKARRGQRGFTLIEVMVTVGIIVILAAMAMVVGIQVKRGAQARSTRATLTALDGVMADYLKDGNLEPVGSSSPTDQNTDFATLWVTDLTVNPSSDYARKLATQHVDVTGGHILDAFGNPILYFPRDYDPTTNKVVAGNKKPFHFVSMGPDGIYGPNATANGAVDDIVSTGSY